MLLDLFKVQFGLSTSVGVVVQARHEQAPDGGRIHGEGAIALLTRVCAGGLRVGLF